MLEVRREHHACRKAKGTSELSCRKEELEAIEHLFKCAEGSTVEAARCTVFLLGWYYPADVGGVDLSQLGWNLSALIVVDMSLVFALMIRLQQSGSDVAQLGFDSRARLLLASWFPEVLGMSPLPPTGQALKAFRRRHDLTVKACAELVRVPIVIYKEWERDKYPIPQALWIELRALMGERRSGLTRPGISAAC